MAKLISILMILFSLNVFANNDAEKDALAHMGVAFASTTFLYGLSKNAFHLSDSDALIFSAATTMFLGTLQEFSHANDLGRPVDGGDILKYGVGTGAAVGTMLMFHF